ncbi:MAG: hypothetical protein ACWA5R_14685 [bacterium]
MKILFIPLTLSLSISSALASDLQQGLDQCMRVSDSLQRLHCFETLARQNSNPENTAQSRVLMQTPDTLQTAPIQSVTPVTSYTQAPPQARIQPGNARIGAWDIEVTNSAIRQSLKVTAINKSKKGRNQYAAPILMKLDCDNAKATAHILWGEEMVSNGPAKFTLDSHDKINTRNWSWADKGRNLNLLNDFSDFVNTIKQADKLTVSAESFDQEQMENYDSGIIDAEFSLSGTQAMLDSIGASCGL